MPENHLEEDTQAALRETVKSFHSEDEIKEEVVQEKKPVSQNDTLRPFILTGTMTSIAAFAFFSGNGSLL